MSDQITIDLAKLAVERVHRVMRDIFNLTDAVEQDKIISAAALQHLFDMTIQVSEVFYEGTHKKRIDREIIAAKLVELLLKGACPNAKIEVDFSVKRGKRK